MKIIVADIRYCTACPFLDTGIGYGCKILHSELEIERFPTNDEFVPFEFGQVIRHSDCPLLKENIVVKSK
jgi:hypothetical protein